MESALTGRRSVRIWGRLVPGLEARARQLGVTLPVHLNRLLERVGHAVTAGDDAGSAVLTLDMRDPMVTELALAVPQLRALLQLQHGMDDPAAVFDRVLTEATGSDASHHRRSLARAAILRAGRPYLSSEEADALTRALDALWPSP